MLRSKEIQLRQSEIRQKLAGYERGEMTDEQRTEEAALQKEYQDNEREYRSALIVEAEERERLEQEAQEENDKPDEFRAECEAFSLVAAVQGHNKGKLEGREAEVSAELEKRHKQAPQNGGMLVPWEAFLSAEPAEERADTAITANASSNLFTRPQMAPVQRLFETTSARMFGAAVLPVEGSPRIPELTAGVSPSWVDEGAGADAQNITVSAHTPDPHTLTGRYLINRQAILSGRMEESLLRADLGMSIAEGLDRAFWRGSGVNPQPSGLGHALAAEAVARQPAFADWINWAMSLYASAKIAGSNDGSGPGVCFAMHPTMASIPFSSTVTAGAAYGPTESAALHTLGIKLIHSPNVDDIAADTKKTSDIFAYVSGGGRSHANLIMWGAPELLADPYTQSKKAQLALTIFAFADIVLTQKDERFKRYTAQTIA